VECKKIKYKDKIAAMLALASCRHDKKGKRQEHRIYYCDICECYHLTSKKFKKDKDYDKM
jgi:hypothetical protein